MERETELDARLAALKGQRTLPGAPAPLAVELPHPDSLNLGSQA